MVEKLNLFRELLHKLADLVTDFIDVLDKIKEFFKGKNNEVVEEVENK